MPIIDSMKGATKRIGKARSERGQKLSGRVTSKSRSSTRDSSDLPFLDARDKAESVSRLADDLQSSIRGEKINPHWIRAIYKAIQEMITAPDGDDFLACFNANFHSGKDHCYIAESVSKPPTLYFVQTKITGGGTKALVGKYVLLQMLSEKKKDQGALVIAWGEVIDSEASEYREWLVKIPNQKKYAEGFHGRSIWVEQTNILRVAPSPVPLINKKGEWVYNP